MDTRATTSKRMGIVPVLIALLFNLVAPIVTVAAPQLATPMGANRAYALGPNGFDLTDGNLAVNGAETDWCTAPAFIRTNDLPTGSSDNAYKSAKENETNPEVDFGSIPNNKVDLDRVYISSETDANTGNLFVYLGWVRNDTTGTGTISFELNQSELVLSNGINHQRMEGDLLFEFNFQANPGSQGGYTVTLTYREWDGEAWGDAQDMAGFAEGSVNAAPVTDCKNADQELGTGAFGEFGVDLTGLLGGDCRAFASIFAKSRSSNQITSELKEVMAPTPIDLSTCGQITILKQDENQQPLGGATFSITPNPFTLTGSLSVTDNVSTDDDDDTAGTIHLSDVEPGEYTVCETAAPAGYIIDNVCETLTVGVNGAATFGPFTNDLGDIAWTKVDEQSGDKVCCATFSLVGTAGAAIGFSRTVTDNGLNDEDADAGELLVTDLKLGTYRITETVAPAGYDLPTPAFVDVILSGETAAIHQFTDAPQADASITKEAVADPIVAGQDAAFTVTVTAGGTGDSEEVVLTDLNDTGHAWAVTGANAGDCDDTSVANGETLRCDFGSVPNGESRVVTITMASDPADCELGIANSASVSSSNDHDTSNNEASDSIAVLCPNPGVVKEAVADPIVAGDDAAFTVTVHAGGTGAAENVALSDLNDSGHAWTISGADAGACADTSVADGETLSCTWDSIPAGQSRTITVTMTSDAGDCELGIANTASITADADVDTSNNESSDAIEVLCPNPSVTKTAVADPIVAGDDAGFDVVVSAGGTGPSDGVVLTDVNDSGHTWTVSGADAADCGSDLQIAAGDTLTCEFGAIPNGQTRTIRITMASDADDCALGIENTASISATADVNDKDNEASASIDVLCPDLELEKTGSDPVNAGDGVSFTLGVTNHGEGAAHGVVLTDELPGDGISTWFISDTENIDETDCSIVSDVLTCSVVELAMDASFSLTVSARSDAGACPNIANDASVAATNEPAADQYANTDSYTITVNCPDVRIDKEPVDSVVSAGEQARFTILVWNDGPGTAYDVEVSDTLPANTLWDLIDADGMDCSVGLVPGQETLTCALDELAPGAENARTIVIGHDTVPAECGVLENDVTVAASNEPAENAGNNADEASIVVECPGLNLTKEADVDPIIAGDEASFTIHVWNHGPGDAFDVTVHDELPIGPAWEMELINGDADDNCGLASSVIDGGAEQMSLDCDFGTLGVTSREAGKIIRVFADTDRADCGLLENTADADGSNLDAPLTASDSIQVKCPTIGLDKENDASGSVLPGTTVTYALTLTVSDGPAEDVMVVDALPVGLEDPTAISDGGIFDDAAGTISWSLGDLADGEYALSYQAVVAVDVENGDELVNVASATSPNSQCPDAETLGPECEDDSTVVVRVPSLVIDKVADVEVITITGPADALVATPSVVTWTLTYTLANGPVTNAVITDEIPDGLVFLDASDGGSFANGVVGWTFPTLSTSGSVTFRTTVDPDAISRVAPTVNVAVIDSDETPADDGRDDVRVEVVPPPLAGNPTPKPSLPNTAVAPATNGAPVTVPVELLVVLFLGSLGGLTVATARARVGRRR